MMMLVCYYTPLLARVPNTLPYPTLPEGSWGGVGWGKFIKFWGTPTGIQDFTKQNLWSQELIPWSVFSIGHITVFPSSTPRRPKYSDPHPSD